MAVAETGRKVDLIQAHSVFNLKFKMMYMFRHQRTALSKYEQLPEEARGDYGARVPGGWELPAQATRNWESSKCP